jgi:predicted MFS family arabinose efflux permease
VHDAPADTAEHRAPPASAAIDVPPARYAWYVVGLLSVVNVFNYVDRTALSMLLPLIKVELSLSDTQLGLLAGLAFALFYGVCGIPIALWADRGVRVNIISVSLAVWSGMTALSGAAQNFWHLFLARMGIGAGEAGCLPPAQSIICDYIPYKRRASAFALHNFGLYLGMTCGMVLAGLLAQYVGWRWTFVLLGLPGIGLALIVKWTLREPVRGYFDGRRNDGGQLSFMRTLKVLWACKTYRLLILFLVVNGFIQYGLYQWWPSLYGRIFDLPLSSIGMKLGMAIGVGSAFGSVVGGLLADKVAARDVRLPLYVSAGLTVLKLPAASGALLVGSPSLAMLCVAATAVFSSMAGAAIFAALYSVVTSQVRAMASAVAIFSTSVIGFGLGPFVVGMLSDALTPSLGIEALRYALLAPLCLLPIMTITLWAAAKVLPEDLRAVGIT